jgi:hypothetical protein
MKSTFLIAVALTTIVSSARTATVVELPMLPAPAHFSAAAYPAHINASGDIVGTVYFTYKPCPRCPAQSVTRSFLVSGGLVSQVGPDGFVIATNNDAGTIVGNLRNPADGLSYPYSFQGGVLSPLDTLPRSVLDLNNAGIASFGPYLNDRGIMAAMLSDLEHGMHAFKYDSLLQVNDLSCSIPAPDYECITGYNTGFDYLHDINNGLTVADAMAVGEDRDNPFSSSYGMQHAFVGFRGQTTYLSTGFTAAALAVNDLGVIVGYDNGQAVVWQPAGEGLWNEVTVASLANDPVWTFTDARSVNNSGVIVGRGTHNGVPAVYALSPELLGVERPAAPALRFAAYPNPATTEVRFRGESPAGVGGGARVTVVDLSGRRVAQLSAATSPFEIRWNGRDADGVRTRPGVYFARLEAGGATAHATVLLTR